ncbi:head completion/stabilization protein [Ursidibacter sp. B-7004-1]
MENVITIPKTAKVADKSAIEPTNEYIRNNGFFPDISLSDVRNAMRADGTVTENRLKNAVIEAITSVNQELKPLMQKSKVSALDEIDSEEIAGESLLIHRYKRAVYCLAMANLYERYRSFDSTKEGADKAQEYENSVDDLRRDARFAIRDLLNINRWTSELI